MTVQGKSLQGQGPTCCWQLSNAYLNKEVVQLKLDFPDTILNIYLLRYILTIVT